VVPQVGIKYLGLISPRQAELFEFEFSALDDLGSQKTKTMKA
jgi:hypothetical protein